MVRVGNRVKLRGSYYGRFDGRIGIVDEIESGGEPKVFVKFHEGNASAPHYELCNTKDLKVVNDEEDKPDV